MQNPTMARRNFLTLSATAAAMAGLSGAASAQPPETKLLKAVQLGMLPKDIPDADKFALAKRCGFQGVEAYPMDDLEAAAEQGKCAREAGVPIHSLCFGGWKHPLSSPDPDEVKAGLAGMRQALRSAKAMGADVVLLVPAVVTETVSYSDAYQRSQANIRKLLPLAEEMGVTIAVENVWNKFLLSPLEFARYVDAFDSPWLRAYFDVGNVIIYGYAQDWIRTLGERIVRIHLKDFRRNGYKWTNLLEGDVNWAEVRKAFDEIGYQGYLTTELKGGDEAYLTDLAGRIDKIIAGV